MRANTEGKAWDQGSLVGRLLTQRGDQAGLPGGESGGCTDQEKSSIREGDRQIPRVFQEIPRDGILMGKPHSQLRPHGVNKAPSREGQDMTIPWVSWGTQTLATVATLYV